MRVRVLTSNIFKRWEPFCVQTIKWKCHRAQDTLILRACRISLSPVQTDATLLPKNPEHCYTLHIVSFCLPCCMLLGVVAQSLKPVKLLAKCDNSQQCCTGLFHLFVFPWVKQKIRDWISFYPFSLLFPFLVFSNHIKEKICSKRFLLKFSWNDETIHSCGLLETRIKFAWKGG